MMSDKQINKQKLIVIAGPTASGKTAISIELAKKINSEIVSADSVQVYKDFNIGSAKVTEEEKQDINHYMLDEVDCTQMYSIYDFKKQADYYIEEILKKDKIPIIAGGTGYYLQSLLKDLDFEDEEASDTDIKKELYKLAEEKGNDYVHEILKDIDIKSYEKIHANNLKRVIRAIEFYKLNNKPISDFNIEEHNKEYKYDVKFFILYFEDRNALYERTDKRVDKMIEQGLVDEVKNIYERLLNTGYTIEQIKSLTSFKAIGYKEILDYLIGNITKEKAIEQIKTNTRHLVKKQYTWFRNQVSDAIWIPVDKYNYDISKIVNDMIENINNT